MAEIIRGPDRDVIGWHAFGRVDRKPVGEECDVDDANEAVSIRLIDADLHLVDVAAPGICGKLWKSGVAADQRLRVAFATQDKRHQPRDETISAKAKNGEWAILARKRRNSATLGLRSKWKASAPKLPIGEFSFGVAIETCTNRAEPSMHEIECAGH